MFDVASSTGTSVLRITKDGNVGIGTTEPVQKLHVEGQCITGDSELSAVSAETIKKQGGVFDVESGKLKDERIKIKDVKSGDYVYSLNQQIGKLELQKINKLLDMGVKPVFKLTTESGKTIKTTANHPYLVKQRANKKPAQSADSSESRYDTRESGLVPAIMIAVQKTLSRVWGVNNFLDRGLAGNRTPKILVPTQIPYHTEPTVFLVYQK